MPMIRLWQTLWLFFSASLSVHAQIDLDDPEVRKKIIAQAIEVTSTPKKQADGTTVFYERHTRLPYKGTGWAVNYYDGGIRLEALLQFKGGKREGLQTRWYENGQMRAEANLIDGKKEGLETRWYENGQKESEGNWKNDKQDGLVTHWHENAIKKSEVYFSKNENRGTCKHWFSNGKLKLIHMHLPHNGKIHGQATNWYDNGQKKTEGNYKDGKQEGLSTFW